MVIDAVSWPRAVSIVRSIGQVVTTDVDHREGDTEEATDDTGSEMEATADGARSESETSSIAPSDLPMLADETGEVEALEGDEEAYEALAEQFEARPHRSSMLERLGWVLRWLSRFLFAHVLFETRCIDNVRDAAERGRVVYVMRSRSLFDYLYFNVAFLEHDLPRAAFANGLTTSWLRGPWAWIKRLFSSAPTDDDSEAFQALVHRGESTFLFLEKPRHDREENLEFSQKYLTRLVRAQRASDEPIYVLPLLLIWEKRPDPKRAGFLEEIFGTAQSPGFTRKVVGFFQTVWQSFLKFGQPMVQVSSGLHLGDFLREYPNAGLSDASELLRDRLMDHLRQERHAILGPTEEPREQLHRELLQRPDVTRELARLADEEDEDEATLRERVHEQIEEIAAQPSLLMLKFFSSVLSLVWYRIYDGFEIDREGLEQVREAAKSSSVVLVPSHKSHIDYLIISYIFYHYGLRCPLIAAGENLDFWPLGPIFRRAGAFFIRRSFAGEDLYPTVFREYLIRKLEQGYPVEFFIEGTRSRTGKLVKPKYGMLDMIVRAHASGRLDPVKIVPISVGYEKIIEEQSYRNERLGADKEGEGLTQLLKTPTLLTSEYGRLYVQFAEPIDLGDYLASHGLDRVDPADDALDDLTVQLAHRINYDINAVSIVTPTALVAMVLLNNPVRGTDRRRFLRSVGFLIYFLRRERPSARLSNPLEDAIRAASPEDDATDRTPEAILGEAVADVLDEAVQLFEDNDQVEIVETRGELFYSVPDEGRLELAYYRNNIVHHFVPEALLATALHRFRGPAIEVVDAREETYFLSRLFKYEWIYEESTEFDNVFRRTLECFDRSSWLELDASRDSQSVASERDVDTSGAYDIPPGASPDPPEDASLDSTVRMRGPFPVELEFFRRTILSFLESYAIMATQLSTLEEETSIQRRTLVEEALERGKNDYLRGRILYYESLSKPTFKNALRLFEDWGLLERTSDEDEPTAYRLSGRAAEGEALDLLQRHLDELVYGERIVKAPELSGRHETVS
jgi:glycerol-3-phosphate O-acyltransferase